MKKALTTVIGSFILVMIITMSPFIVASAEAAQKSISIGAPSIGSVSYVITAGFADFVAKHAGISATAESSGGADANTRLLKRGDIDLAMINTFSGRNAYTGSVQFKKDGKIPVRAVFWGHPGPRKIIVRADSGIRTPKDFEGKTILGKRATGLDIELLFNALSKAYGIDKSKVRVATYGKRKDVTNALRNKTANGCILPSVEPSPSFLELQEIIDLRWISIPEDKWDFILKEMGKAWSMYRMPPNVYKGQTEEIWSPTIQMGLCAMKDFPEEDMYQIIKSVLSRYDDFKLIHRMAERFWMPENTLKYFPIPYHPGVIKYFKEIGIWTAEHQKKQEAVLKEGL
ncbi:MAG: TAXI family TRAP transporter solute-binding subunit [Deltaproteobacteria bacterium]|nr:TAXI family TRAP transporter solute-binding subunit [Deltaproteobacteria bacterium]